MTSSIQAMSGVNLISDLNNDLKTASLGSVTAASGPAVAGVIPEGTGFTDVMSDIATSTVGKLQHAEKVSLDAVQGKANTREVVDALMTAEQSLKTAIAIRDKIVTAYLDITRMQI